MVELNVSKYNSTKENYDTLINTISKVYENSKLYEQDNAAIEGYRLCIEKLNSILSSSNNYSSESANYNYSNSKSSFDQISSKVNICISDNETNMQVLVTASKQAFDDLMNDLNTNISLYNEVSNKITECKKSYETKKNNKPSSVITDIFGFNKDNSSAVREWQNELDSIANKFNGYVDNLDVVCTTIEELKLKGLEKV